MAKNAQAAALRRKADEAGAAEIAKPDFSKAKGGGKPNPFAKFKKKGKGKGKPNFFGKGGAGKQAAALRSMPKDY